MTEYFLALKERKEIAEGTMAFWFDTTNSGFTFKAGQYLNMTILEPKEVDERSNSRPFSIASSPERKDYVIIAMREGQSAFKHNLETTPLGTKVRVLGPFGRFNLHEDNTIPAVFLAGGIGITPMRSIIEWATGEKLNHKLYLFYSNRTPASSAFLQDFEKWSQENPNLKITPTITDSDDPNWPYEKGMINQNLLVKYLQNLSKPIYYIAGPEGMVSALSEMLLEAGVNQGHIVTEKFAGY